MRTHLILAILFGAVATRVLAETKNSDPSVRSNQYIDDTHDDFLSGWKGMITNVAPDKVLESGVWFEPSKTPRPFGKGEIMPFSDDLRAKLRANSTDGLVVIKDNRLVGQYFRFGFEIDDIHLIHSTGKCFTSFALEPVYDRIGKEGLDRKLSEYLPRLKGKFFGECTLAQALDMQNGMEWTENYEDPNTATMLSGPVSGWDPLDPAKGPESWHERMFDFPKCGDHGKTWVYNNSAVVASAFAAEAIAGRPYSELVQASYNKLGFEDRSWYVCNSFSEFSAEGGQAISIRDHAKLGRFMLEAKQSAYVNDVWTIKGNENNPADATFLKKYGPLVGAIGYKNYWYRIGEDEILALGSSGLFLYVDRKKSVIISKFSSFVQGQSPTEFAAGFALVKEIAATY